MDDDRVIDKKAHDEAIGRVCALFDEMGLTLFERWHVCECVELACLQAMGRHAYEALAKVKAGDVEKIRASWRGAPPA